MEGLLAGDLPLRTFALFAIAADSGDTHLITSQLNCIQSLRCRPGEWSTTIPGHMGLWGMYLPGSLSRLPERLDETKSKKSHIAWTQYGVHLKVLTKN